LTQHLIKSVGSIFSV